MAIVRMDASSENIQFSWGRKRAKGGAKMDTQFYDSFTLDNVKYSLYDCVHLFKHGDPVPYIGKIMKMWQQNQAKKVKILWFFTPDEITNYLRGPVAEKEIFLASGEGIGLADINPVEAVAGKCTVVCISKDKRNRQPSPREEAIADYIFYRFFDVGNCTLSDQVPEKIATQQVHFLLNPKEEQVASFPDQEVRGMDQQVTLPPPQSAVKEVDESLAVKEDAVKEDESSPVKKEDESVAVKKEDESSTVKKEDHNPVAAVPLSQSVVKDEDKIQVASITLPPAVEDNDHKPTQSVLKRTQKVLTGEMPAKKLKMSQDLTVQNVAPDDPDRAVRPGPLEARQADKSKWFKLSWDEILRDADEQERLVYIQNLDVQFGPSEIQELIHEALQLSCTARPINHPTYDDPNNGKAYAVFRTKSAADTAIVKINSGLVVGGRPLYCSKGLLKVPEPSASGSLVGHLTIYKQKMAQRQREEQKKAVSTSHCSQPNTMEYDLALDWMLSRENQARRFSMLHKKHKEERKAFEGRLDSK